MPISNVRPVKGYTNASMQWGYLESGKQPCTELTDEANICCQIDVWTQYQNWYTYNLYDPPYDGYTPYSTIVYDNLLYTLQDNCLATDNFWVGDYCPSYPDGAWHWTCYGYPDNPQDLVFDSMIYYIVGDGSYQYFDFIWTCSNGGCYFTPGGQIDWNPSLNPDEDPPNYGYFDSNGLCIGMPLAWTGLSNMRHEAYANPDTNCPYCYISFQGGSPYLKDTLNNSNDIMYYFVYYFYQYLTGAYNGGHHTVGQSLDYASQQLWGETYGACTLNTGWVNSDNYNCRMRVYGNGDYSIP
jgi:hypothetical protein